MTSLGNIGNCYGYMGDYEKSEKYLLRSVEISKKSGIKKNISAILGNLAIIYVDRGQFSKALEYYQAAITACEEQNDQNNLSFCLANIGQLYYQLENNKEAVSYLEKARKIKEKQNDKKGLANIYQNLGVVKHAMKDTAKAVEYCSRALALREEIKDIYGLAESYNFFATHSLNTENIKEAIEFALKALNLQEKMDDKPGLVDSYLTLGKAYRKNNEQQKAVQAIQKAIEIATPIGIKRQIIEANKELARSYYKLHKFKEAYDYFNIYANLKDSILSENTQKQIAEMQTKYETEKKEKEIELLNKDKLLNETEIRKQTLLRNSFIIGFALLLILAYLLYTRYKIKRKANEELTLKNQLISQQKEEISAQRDEILLKNEVLQQANEEITTQRDEIDLQKKIIEEKNHEVMDSIHYALRIQNAVIPDETILQITFADYFILFKPKDIVSGDFFWFAKRKQWILFAVADCTGHGVPGAFMSMLGISFLNEIVARHEVQTAADALNELRNGIIKALKQNISIGNNNSKQPSIIRDGMDIAFCALNTETLELHFAGANNPLWIIKFEDLKMNQFENEMSLSNFQINQSSNNIFEIKGDKQPIGIHEKMNPFTNNKIQLKKGDILYLMSDGFQDQFGGLSGKKFMTKKLKTLLSDISTKPLKEQYSILEKKLFDWQNINDQKYQQTDDITVMGIKI